MREILYLPKIAELYHNMLHSFRTSPYMHGDVRIGVLRCADGRMRTFNHAIGAKPGMFRNMRSVGAIKTLRSYSFRDRLNDWISTGRHHVLFLTYHYDSIDNERLGCAGFEHNIDAAIAHQTRLASQIRGAYGIHGLVIGYDTRLEQLRLHSSDGLVMYARQFMHISSDDGMRRIQKLWPSLPDMVVPELYQIFRTNAEKVAENVSNGYHERLIEHEEVGVFIGRSCGWLVDGKEALQCAMIEDTTLNAEHEVSLGLTLLKKNLAAGRIPIEKGVFLFVGIPYFEKSNEFESSRMAALEWSQFALDIMRRNMPEIEEYLGLLVGVVSEESRQVTIVQGSDQAKELFAPSFRIPSLTRDPNPDSFSESAM